jgi:hypothetical protein
MASAAGREFQFLRAALQREIDKDPKKFDLTQLVQSAGDRVEPIGERGPEKRLTKFPARFERDEKEDPKDAQYNLANYDVIVALDPDWTQLDARQQDLLRRWVDKGGGLVVVAGEIHTPKLASPAHREALKSIRELYPVLVADIRLHLLDRTENRPQRLTFTGNAGETPWLKLGDEEDFKGWATFHGKVTDDVPERGFYRCYPVEKVKAGAVVLATVGKEMPFLVRNKAGSGTVIYAGSDEFWRLRQARPEWHEGLWFGLIRDAGSAARK